MSVFCVRKICNKCHEDLKIMWIGGFHVFYCPRCTNPNKKKRRMLLTRDEVKIYRRLRADKNKIKKEVWAGKQMQIQSVRNISYFKKPPSQFRNDGTLSDRYIKYKRSHPNDKILR